jgi:hypothetical protein
MAKPKVFPRVEVAERDRRWRRGGRIRDVADVADLLPRGLVSNELR